MFRSSASSRSRFRNSLIAATAVCSVSLGIPSAYAATVTPVVPDPTAVTVPAPVAPSVPDPTAVTTPAPVTPAVPSTGITPAPAGIAPSAPAAPVVPSKACTSSPKAPWSLQASRDTVDPTTFTIVWNKTACATRYNVSVFSNGTDNVNVVDGNTTSYTVKGTDPAKTYAIQVNSRNDAGLGGTTSTYYLRPSVPEGSKKILINYTDVSAAHLTWAAPTDRHPVTYHLKVTRLSDNKVITDTDIDGALTDTPLDGLDARGMYVVTLQPTNASGKGPISRIVIGQEKPNPVKSISAIRDPGNPKQVILSWLPSDNTLHGNVLGYEIGYGVHSADSRVFVKVTDGQVTLPADRSVVVVVRVITDTGKSRWSKHIRIPMADAPVTATTNPSIDLLDQDGVISVAASQPILNSNRLVVKVRPTANNGGFTDTQYSQGGANVLTFRTVPQGSYIVTVENNVGKEMARKYVNVGNVGVMLAPDWKTYTGNAAIVDNKVSLLGGETRVFSTRQFASQDVVVDTNADLNKGQGYGVWFRATADPANTKVSGLSVQYDPGWGNKFIIRQWNNGTECSNPIATTPFPSGMKVYAPHDVIVAAQGDTLYVTIDGQKLFDVPSLSAAIAANSCHYPAPTGTMVGLRTWGSSAAIFTGTTVR